MLSPGTCNFGTHGYSHNSVFNCQFGKVARVLSDLSRSDVVPCSPFFHNFPLGLLLIIGYKETTAKRSSTERDGNL